MAIEWKPIATAPKNGRRVLLYYRGIIFSGSFGYPDSAISNKKIWSADIKYSPWSEDITHWAEINEPELQ